MCKCPAGVQIGALFALKAPKLEHVRPSSPSPCGVSCTSGRNPGGAAQT
jgi:hypothetical protein